MKLHDYISSKSLSLCFLGFEAIILLMFSLLLELGPGIVFFTESLLLMLTTLWLMIGFYRQKKRYQKLTQTIAQLEKKYLVGEVIPKPKDTFEAVYYEIMKTISRSAIGAVEQERTEKEEYQAYVESWIHEMKTPLTACSLILENGGNAAKLSRELKRADNLTESILYYARMRNPENDTMIRSVCVSDIVDECIKDQMSLLIAAGISIDTEGDFTVLTDEKALGFMIKQLLCNSAKYCPSCHISIRAEEGTIFYEDNGIGIPAHELSRITERGFTGTNGRKLGNSTGMGLFLVNELCHHLGIELLVNSEVGKFTRFTFIFPTLTKL